MGLGSSHLEFCGLFIPSCCTDVPLDCIRYLFCCVDVASANSVCCCDASFCQRNSFLSNRSHVTWKSHSVVVTHTNRHSRAKKEPWSPTLLIFALALSPEKKTTKTLFSRISPVAGSDTLPTPAVRRNMFPRVARKSRRSKAGSFSWEMRPAMNPRRTALGS